MRQRSRWLRLRARGPSTEIEMMKLPKRGVANVTRKVTKALRTSRRSVMITTKKVEIAIRTKSIGRRSTNDWIKCKIVYRNQK